MKLAEGHVQGPLMETELSQAVQRKMNTFTDADSRTTNEQQRIAEQVIGAPEFLLEQAILV